MKLNILLSFTLFFLVSVKVSSQYTNFKSQFKLGLGYGLIGKGDHNSILLINEFSQNLTKRIECNINFGFGKGIPENNFLGLISLSMFEVNINSLFIPFYFREKYKLKLGTGLSFINIDKVGSSFGHIDSSGILIIDEYQIENSKNIGYNLQIENEFRIIDRISLSLLFQGQFYYNNNTIFGGILKLGYLF